MVFRPTLIGLSLSIRADNRCDSVVPELKTSLLSTLVTQLFRHVGLSLASRLEAFVTAPSADRSPPDAKRIECLTQTIACTDEFIAQLAPVLAPAQGGGGAAAQGGSRPPLFNFYSFVFSIVYWVVLLRIL